MYFFVFKEYIRSFIRKRAWEAFLFCFCLVFVFWGLACLKMSWLPQLDLRVCAIMDTLHPRWTHSELWEDELDSEEVYQTGGAPRGAGLGEGGSWPVLWPCGWESKYKGRPLRRQEVWRHEETEEQGHRRDRSPLVVLSVPVIGAVSKPKNNCWINIGLTRDGYQRKEF